MAFTTDGLGNIFKSLGNEINKLKMFILFQKLQDDA